MPTSWSFVLTRHPTTMSTSTITQTFSTTTSTPTLEPTSTSTSTTTSTPAPRFPRPTTSPTPLAASAQPSHFPTAVVLGVSAAVLLLLVILLGVLGWKGKLRKLNPYQNPYVRKAKRAAQDERVAKAERERARERGWGIGNEREMGEAPRAGVGADMPELQRR
ncbi:hypothetical protein K505DRAFT_326726 [Melanomma pulvis-pyrius CBS 109.77]|uniref:Uncharacterized protein n=1 Tax=Melanomma pulvis-pyrius CBS 109.77 TaxID=1314802 RepID=A0A6A6X5I8_9PLEO|nr:hypothetical protein K505DRAFT_326726 [Melanomma pulvis-pyrius CBS 109.77]